MTSIFYKMVKFGLVGFSGLFVDFGITYLLKEKVKINKYAANVIGFVCASSSNFIINKTWTFQNTENAFLMQYIIYFCITLGGLGINQLALYTAHAHCKIGFYYAKIVATLLVGAWNFTLNYWITFS